MQKRIRHEHQTPMFSNGFSVTHAIRVQAQMSFTVLIKVSIGQRCTYRVRIRCASQSTRLLTNTAEVPVNSAFFKLTTSRTVPSPGRRTASVKVQEVLSRTVTAR